jgi:hypothetical protein
MRAPTQSRDRAATSPVEDESFVRRRAVLRHHRRSRQLREIAANTIWLLLLLLCGFLAGGLLGGVRPG